MDGFPVASGRLPSSTPSGFPVTPQTSVLSAQSPVLPKCWRIMYQVLDLYSSLPKEAKTKGYMKRSIFGATGYPGKLILYVYILFNIYMSSNIHL